jgi:diguanylate cyclase (GGDEF)-like protein
MDVVGRLSGDEFGVLIATTNIGWAQATLQKIQRQLLRLTREQDYPVTVSMGAAIFSLPPATVDELLTQSDECVAFAKRKGENIIECAVVEARMNEPAEARKI